MQAGVFVLAEYAVDLFQPLAAETLDEVVFERDKEDGNARIALTAASAAELVVDTARFVPFGAENAQAACLDDLYFFRIRFRLVSVI